MALIEIRGLTKYYRMGDSLVRALDGVDLTIERGEFVAITGASGSGKSTMMHLLGCLDRPTEGAYVLNGRDVSGMSDGELADVRNRYIGFVFQTFNLINRTSALENVSVPLFYARRINTREASLRALQRVGLGPRAHHRPNELSGGERQRVAIARAIVTEPLLLLADEPTGNLDSRTGEQIMQIFHDLNAQGVTIALVTHEAEVAAQARRIVQMRDGRILSDRPTEGGGRRSVATAADSGAAPALAPSAPTHAEPREHTHVRTAGPARVARGATGAAACAILALLLALAVWIGSAVAARAYPDLSRQEFGKTVPPHLIAIGSAIAVGSLLTLSLGLVGAFWGYFVARRIRTAPEMLRGARRARTAVVAGWLAVALPFLPGILRLGRWLASGGA